MGWALAHVTESTILLLVFCWWKENYNFDTGRKGHPDTSRQWTSPEVEKVLDFEAKNEHIWQIMVQAMINTNQKSNTTNKENMQILEDKDKIPTTGRQLWHLNDKEALRLFPVQHMNCAVCTLHLAISDGLKNHHVATLIGKLRQVAATARTPKKKKKRFYSADMCWKRSCFELGNTLIGEALIWWSSIWLK